MGKALVRLEAAKERRGLTQDESGLRLIIKSTELAGGAFHVRTHKLSCVIVNHPKLKEGLGSANGEDLERVWSQLLSALPKSLVNLGPAKRADMTGHAACVLNAKANSNTPATLMRRAVHAAATASRPALASIETEELESLPNIAKKDTVRDKKVQAALLHRLLRLSSDRAVRDRLCEKLKSLGHLKEAPELTVEERELLGLLDRALKAPVGDRAKEELLCIKWELLRWRCEGNKRIKWLRRSISEQAFRPDSSSTPRIWLWQAKHLESLVKVASGKLSGPAWNRKVRAHLASLREAETAKSERYAARRAAARALAGEV